MAGKCAIGDVNCDLLIATFLGRKRPQLAKISQITVPADQQQPSTPNLDRRATAKIGDDTIEINPENVEAIKELGRGAYGIVERIRHRPSGLEMALKVGSSRKVPRLRNDLNFSENQRARNAAKKASDGHGSSPQRSRLSRYCPILRRTLRRG